MDTHYHLSIAHYFLLFLLASSYMQSTTKLCFCLAGGELSSSVKTNSCIDEERQALLIFKRHLVDPSGRLSSWMGHDCCRWEGMSCNNKTGRVVKMDLRNPYSYDDPAYEKAQLGGKINASLLSLKHLNYLDLSSNGFFHGIQVPKFFGELKSLQYLNLSSASFGGEIPPSLGNLSSLNFLDLGGYPNQLSSSRNLNWLSRLSSLKYLDLGGMDLSTTGVNWAYAVNMLPSLAELHLSSCQIESISLSLQSINLTSLFNLTSLITLDLSWNDFGDPFPSEFANFKSLEHLDLSGTGLKGQIPKVIGNLCKLKVLSLSRNKFNGGIEEVWRSFSNCSNIALESLDLSYCDLRSQLPASLGMFKSLQNLNLRGDDMPDLNPDILGNYLWGSIPDSIGNLSFLKTLDLSYNMMNGSIPQSLGQLSQLVSLDLSSNLWEGNLTEAHFINLTRLQDFRVGDRDGRPTSLIFDVAYDWVPPFKLHTIYIINCQIGPGFGLWLQSQIELRVIILSGNGISDFIPEEWLLKISSQLIYLDLSYNQFRGNLPSNLKSPKLEQIDLSHNQLEGPLPLWSATKVTKFDLESNSFSGPIPSNIDQMMPNLEDLLLSENHLNGNIPRSICNMQQLSTLYLDENHLNGTIPPSVYNMQQLGVLSLRSNQFHGEFRLAWSVGSNMTYLDVSQNNLSGNIPTSLGVLSSLEVLKLNNNNFDGAIPPSVCNMQQLEILYLRSNQFYGELPRAWNVGSKLVFLDVSLNNLSGNIPTSLGVLSSLQVLKLNNNNFDGAIPPFVCNMHQLGVLSLRSNQFCGELPRAWSMESNMLFLDVGHNNLSGNIPTSLGVLSSLQILKLNNNNFGGEIPDSLKNCSSLESIDLGDNNLSGNIPLLIGRSNVSMMRMLRLRSNYFSGHISQQLCNLRHLHILDLSHNNFSGTIPMCLDNLTSLVNNDSDAYSEQATLPLKMSEFEQVTLTLKGIELMYNSIRPQYIEQVTLTLKGTELVYNTTLYLVKSIDLSSNNLQGEIPEKICSLILLGTLNLSMNQLTGKIPSKVGNLRWLETLDLSHNHLSGQIPQSLSSLTFLNHLNMSYNNLSGKIPTGNQLQTLLDLSIYMDNPLLCGVPLPTKCNGDDTFPTKDAKDKNEDGNDTLWFYVSMVLGFILGFWGVCGTLILKTSWRYAYFQFFNNIKDKQLGVLSLRSNQFYGELPRAWNVGSKLGFLHVGLNNLSGDILTSLGVLSSLLVLKLNNNNFGCEIPNSLQNCSLLMSIDLGDNKLCGNIPLWMYNLEMSWCISYEMYNAAFYSSLFACPKIHTVFAFQEKAFLKKLKFHLNAPTPYVFMLRFLKAARSETKLEHLAFYLIELCLVECEALRFKPSLLCAAALYVARCTLQITPAWTPLLCKHARYEVSQIRDCAEMVLRFHKAARMGSLKVTYEKYSSPDLSSVAAIKPLDTLPLRFSLEG